MSKLNKTTYYLKDVAVVQSPISYLNHRSDVNPYVYPFEFKDKPMLPIFVAPMSTVTDENNYKTLLFIIQIIFVYSVCNFIIKFCLFFFCPIT